MPYYWIFFNENAPNNTNSNPPYNSFQSVSPGHPVPSNILDLPLDNFVNDSAFTSSVLDEQGTPVPFDILDTPINPCVNNSLDSSPGRDKHIYVGTPIPFDIVSPQVMLFLAPILCHLSN